jgi:hypothetical protein
VARRSAQSALCRDFVACSRRVRSIRFTRWFTWNGVPGGTNFGARFIRRPALGRAVLRSSRLAQDRPRRLAVPCGPLNVLAIVNTSLANPEVDRLLRDIRQRFHASSAERRTEDRGSYRGALRPLALMASGQAQCSSAGAAHGERRGQLSRLGTGNGMLKRSLERSLFLVAGLVGGLEHRRGHFVMRTLLRDKRCR